MRRSFCGSHRERVEAATVLASRRRRRISLELEELERPGGRALLEESPEVEAYLAALSVAERPRRASIDCPRGALREHSGDKEQTEEGGVEEGAKGPSQTEDVFGYHDASFSPWALQQQLRQQQDALVKDGTGQSEDAAKSPDSNNPAATQKLSLTRPTPEAARITRRAQNKLMSLYTPYQASGAHAQQAGPAAGADSSGSVTKNMFASAKKACASLVWKAVGRQGHHQSGQLRESAEEGEQGEQHGETPAPMQVETPAPELTVAGMERFGHDQGSISLDLSLGLGQPGLSSNPATSGHEKTFPDIMQEASAPSGDRKHPSTWQGDRQLLDWVEWSPVNAALRPTGLMEAQGALVHESRAAGLVLSAETLTLNDN